MRNSNDSNYDSLTEQVEIRYDGIEDLLLYAKAEFNQVDGYVRYDTAELDANNTLEEALRLKWSDVDDERYTLGANWYPLSGLSFAAQYYHRSFEEDYDNFLEERDAQLASHEIDVDDVNLRMTWRPMPCLTLVSRYDYQQATTDTVGIDGANKPLPGIESADVTRNIFSQTATWMPMNNLYLQGSISYVDAETDTPADLYHPARITDMENDYLTANLTIGWALNDATDLTFGYTFYYADNYEVPVIRTGAPATIGYPGSVGFGTTMEEHVFSVSLNRRINNNMLWNLGYAYYTSNDGTSGGYNDFEAHMISTGLRIGF